MIEITVPVLPESVTEGTLTTWCKQEGEHVKRDDVIAELETDKVILEIPAPHDGVLSNIIVSEGSTVTSAQLLAHLKPQAVIEETVTPVTETLAMPSARLEAQRSGVELADVAGSGRNGRILKEDVQRVTPAPVIQPERVAEIAPAKPLTPGARQERREPMSRLRQRIAERLLASQQNNAILTTFNEVNMQSVMDLRTRWKDRFAEKHGVKLGFMSFFVKAVTRALEALQGGTFSITNGGTFGSMMSTPIINPPQSAILGMHAITPRPVAENGQVVIRPMMYLALSYDHRIIDGQEAVQTLVAIRELLESPEQLLLDL
ncbi:TPA: 2-oxo acid dehydrogenase subunit E2 [Escherichia coli]|nr:2-oxo acid dehydrogenase subunit E2 [Escherichia coli]